MSFLPKVKPYFSSTRLLSVTWPMAPKIASASMTNSEPSTGMGLRLPLASGSPSSIFRHCTPTALPSLTTTSWGAVRKLNLTPSSSAASTSHWLAGNSLRVRRYSRLTSSKPTRRAVLVTSMATLPPPITIALPLVIGNSSPRFASFKRWIPSKTPSASSFLSLMLVPLWAPMAMSTASWFALISSKLMS